jgi:hypothetical protein
VKELVGVVIVVTLVVNAVMVIVVTFSSQLSPMLDLVHTDWKWSGDGFRLNPKARTSTSVSCSIQTITGINWNSSSCLSFCRLERRSQRSYGHFQEVTAITSSNAMVLINSYDRPRTIVMRAFCRCTSSDQQKDQNIDFHCRRSIYSIRSLIQEIRMVLGMEVEVDFASTEHNATRSIYTWALLPETGPLGQEDDALCAAAAFLYPECDLSHPLCMNTLHGTNLGRSLPPGGTTVCYALLVSFKLFIFRTLRFKKLQFTPLMC